MLHFWLFYNFNSIDHTTTKDDNLASNYSDNGDTNHDINSNVNNTYTTSRLDEYATNCWKYVSMCTDIFFDILEPWVDNENPDVMNL